MRDKPLTFHWHAPPLCLDALDIPATRSPRHAQAQASILLEAALAHAEGFPAVSYSRRKASYANLTRYHGTPFTFATVVPTIDMLAGIGLLENQIAPGRGPSGHQSTFRASPALLAAIPAGLVAAARHSIPELVELRDATGHPTPYRDTARTERMRLVLKVANDAVQSCHIGLDGQQLSPGGGAITADGHVIFPGMRTLYRVFNVDFGHGGRLYGPFWQQAPKAARGRLNIDGEPVVELDHAQLHPRLLYAMAGKELVGKAYELDGWDRPLCKKAFNILLNASNYRSALGALAKEIKGPAARRQAWKLIAEMKLKHSPVAEYFHSGIGLRLQCRDADMAEEVISRLLNRGIVTLPVHDSFIVQGRHSALLKEAMDDAICRACRFA